MIPEIAHEIVHACLLALSIFTTVYSLLRYKERTSLALSSFWIWMAVLSIAVFVNSAVHTILYEKIPPSIGHDINLVVLALLGASLAYYAIALNKFQKTALSFLHRGLEPINLLAYLDMLTLFRGDVGYAVAYNMGRSYAEKIYRSSNGDISKLAHLFESETGIKKVVLSEKSAIFTVKRKNASNEAVKALEFFLKGYWERLLELITGNKVSVSTRINEKGPTIEVLITS